MYIYYFLTNGDKKGKPSDLILLSLLPLSLRLFWSRGSVPDTNSWLWKVFTEKQNINDASTFNIGISKPGETYPRFISGHFNILCTPASASVTSIISSTSPVLTSSSSSSAPTSSSSSSPSDSGLNSEPVLGFAVDLALGLGLVFRLFWDWGSF